MKLLSALLLTTLVSGVAPTAYAQLDTTGVQSPPAVHVRWIVDVSKKLGYENFDGRVSDNSSWKSQQGIVFLTPDEIAIYQVKQGPPVAGGASLLLHASILDARDGHEIKSLDIPAKRYSAKISPTHGGGFLVDAGDAIYLYSAQFQQVAARNLPASKETLSEEWQVDVGPSGAQVILVHQQMKDNPKEKRIDSHADVEVLDAQTLKTIKAFT